MKIGPDKAKVWRKLVQTVKVCGKLVQAKLKFEENWSRQSLSLKTIGPGNTKLWRQLVQATLNFEDNWSMQSKFSVWHI